MRSSGCGLLDDVVFDLMGLTTGEREVVVNSIRARVEKARSE